MSASSNLSRLDARNLEIPSALAINTRFSSSVAVALTTDSANATYLLTGGLIGVLSDFMRELARRGAYGAPRALNYADCQQVLAEVSHAGSPHQLAFQTDANAVEEGAEYLDVSLAALKQAYVHVLTSNSASVPIRKK